MPKPSPYVNAFNEGYSKACFDIGFSQGYNQGYNQGYTQGYTQGNNHGYVQGYDQCYNNIITNNKYINKYTDEYNNVTTQTPNEQYNEQELSQEQAPEQKQELSEEQEPSNVFDDNIELDLEWFAQDYVDDPVYTTLTNQQTFGIADKEEDKEEDKEDNTDKTVTFTPYTFNTNCDSISWNVIKEDTNQESSDIPCYNPFDTQNIELSESNDFKFDVDSQIFSSFSWGDILTQNIDDSCDNTNIFSDNNTYVPLPMNDDVFKISPINEDIFMIQESDNECDDRFDNDIIIYNEMDDSDEISEESELSEISEEINEESEESEEIHNEQCDESSWIYIPTASKPTLNQDDSKIIDIDSYSFNFDSITDESLDVKKLNGSVDISLDSSISSESLHNSTFSPVYNLCNEKYFQ